jgi:restriction system protein
MAIPDFQSLMLPMMAMFATRAPQSIPNREFMDTLARQFELSEDERNELLASGRQSRFENRVYWALGGSDRGQI